jgi:hypothetical protein
VLFGSEQRFVLAVTFASTQRTEDKANAIMEKTRENAENIKALLRLQSSGEDEAPSKLLRYDTDDGVVDKEKTIDLLRPVLYATSANSDVEETFIRNRRALIDGTGVGKEAFQHGPLSLSLHQ